MVKIMDYQPTARGDSIRKIVSTTHMTPFKQVIIGIIKPAQYDEEKSQGSQIVFLFNSC